METEAPLLASPGGLKGSVLRNEQITGREPYPRRALHWCSGAVCVQGIRIHLEFNKLTIRVVRTN